MWQDRWLPNIDVPVIQSPKMERLEEMLVSDLITQDRRWERSLLNSLFLNRDVELICSIPLSLNDKDDTLMWRHDIRGEYSVKFAYRVVHDREVDLASVDEIASWHHFWVVKVPPNVHNICWKAVVNALPTLDRLQTCEV